MTGPKWHVTVSDGRRGMAVYGFDPLDPPADVMERMAREIQRVVLHRQHRPFVPGRQAEPTIWQDAARAALVALAAVPAPTEET